MVTYENISEFYQLQSASADIGKGILDNSFLEDLKAVVDAINVIEKLFSKPLSKHVMLSNDARPSADSFPTLYVDYGEGNVLIRERIDYLRTLGKFPEFEWKYTPNMDDFRKATNKCGIDLRQILEMRQSIGRIISGSISSEKCYKWSIKSGEDLEIDDVRSSFINTTFRLQVINDRKYYYALNNMYWYWTYKIIPSLPIDRPDYHIHFPCDIEPYTEGGWTYYGTYRQYQDKLQFGFYQDPSNTVNMTTAKNTKIDRNKKTISGVGYIHKLGESEATNGSVDSFEDDNRSSWRTYTISIDEHGKSEAWYSVHKKLFRNVNINRTHWYRKNFSYGKVFNTIGTADIDACRCYLIGISVNHGGYYCRSTEYPYDHILMPGLRCIEEVPNGVKFNYTDHYDCPYKNVYNSKLNGRTNQDTILGPIELSPVMVTSDTLPRTLGELAQGMVITDISEAMTYIWSIPRNFYMYVKDVLDNLEFEDAIIEVQNIKDDPPTSSDRLGDELYHHDEYQIDCWTVIDTPACEETPEWVADKDALKDGPYPWDTPIYGSNSYETLKKNYSADVSRYIDMNMGSQLDINESTLWLAWDRCILPDGWYKVLEVSA